MSKKHVEEYYLTMLSDYTEMKTVLDELQKNITDDTASTYINQINNIKDKVKLLEANYKRLSYIMFLLNKPNKKSKEDRYLKRENKRLNSIPENAKEEFIRKENKEIINYIKNIK